MIQPAIVRAVRVDDALITFVLADGREVSAPTAWSGRLRSATQTQRDHFEIEPEGLIVEWPDLDEHVGVWSLLGVSEEEAMVAAGLQVLQPVDR
jgi:Protein of unknown function (DUF2442)